MGKHQPFYDTYRLQNEEIRPGNSPQDSLVLMRANSGSQSVPFVAGTTVLVIPMVAATVAADGDGLPVVDIGALNLTAEKVLILGKSHNLQL